MFEWKKVNGCEMAIDENGVVRKVVGFCADGTYGEAYIVRWSEAVGQWERVTAVKFTTLKSGLSRGAYEIRAKASFGEMVDARDMRHLVDEFENLRKVAKAQSDKFVDLSLKGRSEYLRGADMGSADALKMMAERIDAILHYVR